MADLFISFIHEEEKVAVAVQRLLQTYFEKRGVFFSSDKWQIFAGEQWFDRIKAELELAKVVVLLLSPQSVKRPWVNFEAGAACLTGKVIIPACFAGLSKEDLPKPYSNIQALDLPDDHYYLITSVAHHLNPDLIPPPPLIGDHEMLRALREEIEQVKKTASPQA